MLGFAYGPVSCQRVEVCRPPPSWARVRLGDCSTCRLLGLNFTVQFLQLDEKACKLERCKPARTHTHTHTPSGPLAVSWKYLAAMHSLFERLSGLCKHRPQPQTCWSIPNSRPLSIPGPFLGCLYKLGWLCPSTRRIPGICQNHKEVPGALSTDHLEFGLAKPHIGLELATLYRTPFKNGVMLGLQSSVCPVFEILETSASHHESEPSCFHGKKLADCLAALNPNPSDGREAFGP